MKLVLTSTSKFKSDILNQVFLKHTQVESDFDETNVPFDNVYNYVKALSYGKVNSVKQKNDEILLGLDTVVYVNNRVLEKPKDINEAKQNIYECMNTTTRVITGVTLKNNITNEIVSDYSETLVTMKNISEKDIDFYIKNEPNILYASGFVIETIMSNFVEKIEGSYYNILGIPVELIYKYINKWGYFLEDLMDEKDYK